MTVPIPTLSGIQPIVDPETGGPTPWFIQWFGNTIAQLVKVQAVSASAQPASPRLTALASLPSAAGAVVDSGSGTFAIAPFGTASLDVLRAMDADGRYVRQDQASRPGYSAYAGQTISNPPTQAQVQATDDALKALSAAFVAALTALNAAAVLA